MAGRKSKYLTHVEPRMIEIKGWIRNGMIDKDVSKKLGVSYSTFRDYMKVHPELATSVYESKEVADFKVEDSLYKAAIGYEYEEVKMLKELKLGADGKEEFRTVEITTTKKTVQGSVSAQQFWLKNRVPEKYKDRIDTNISGSLGIIPVDEETIAKIMVAENEKT